MLTSIKRCILISITALLLAVSSGCMDIKDDYHASKDNDWLTEQVEKGKLTKEQADQIRKDQEKLNK